MSKTRRWFWRCKCGQQQGPFHTKVSAQRDADDHNRGLRLDTAEHMARTYYKDFAKKSDPYVGVF